MGNIKGTAMEEIRVLMQKNGLHKEKELIQLLTPDEKNAYKNILPISWFPVELLTEITYKAVIVLFPGDPDGMIKIGIHSSRYSLSTVYKIFMKVISIQQIFKQAAKIWKTYHSQGRAEMEYVRGQGNVINYFVYDYPDLSRRYLPVMAAYMQGTMSMTGAKNVNIKIMDNDPQAWKFVITWE